ncbi:MAG: DUF2027 domain-containing protein [Prevotella sp.]|nr:DUF2027 domain-containing protein [Prevotella sp.]
MKIGDQVRFLSEVGGGKVAGFQGKNVVLVEDEDGFQVPMRLTEVVVVGNEDYDTKHAIEVRNEKKKTVQEEETEPADNPITFRAKPEERRGGDKLNAFLAFVPMDVKNLSQTRFESYLVNDSNYYLRYIYMTAEGAAWTVRAEGEIEPNTKEFIEEFGREDLNALEHGCIQMLAYKRNKHFLLKQVVNAQMRIDPVKFYKLHAFRENDFFEQSALIYAIIENDIQKVRL